MFRDGTSGAYTNTGISTPYSISRTTNENAAHAHEEPSSDDTLGDCDCCADDSCVSSLTAGTRRHTTVSSKLASQSYTSNQPQHQREHKQHHQKQFSLEQQQQQQKATTSTNKKNSDQQDKSSKERIPSFSSKLYGRQEQLEAMLEAYSRIHMTPSAKNDAHDNRANSHSRRAEVLLVHGPAGCGKTCLAESLRAPIVRLGGYYVSGKFECGTATTAAAATANSNNITATMMSRISAMTTHAQDYPALVEALSDLCDLIAQSEGFGPLQQQMIRRAIGIKDAQRLSGLLGNLHRITGDLDHYSKLQQQQQSDSYHHSYDANNDGDDASSIASASREVMLQWSFQKFLRACSAITPVCIVLDDLQWADAPSLKLLQALVKDASIHNVLFLLVYRDDDSKNNSSELDATSRAGFDPKLLFPIKSSKNHARISDIAIPNLGLEPIHRWLSGKLRVAEPIALLPLAEVILRKTHGHPQCILLYLEHLMRTGLLVEQQEQHQNGDSHSGGGEGRTYVWDLARIQSETNVTDNVVDLMLHKSQHKYVQLILKVASAIGFEFDRRLLEKVIVGECTKATTKTSTASTSAVLKQKIHKYLAMALRDALIEKTAYAGRYKFAHDRVQDAVYQQIPQGRERQDLHLRIGDCIVRELLSEEEEDWMIFAAAEQYNRAGLVQQHWKHNQSLDEESVKRRMELMRINIRASRLAQQRGLLLVAQEFCSNAQELVLSQSRIFSSQQYYEMACEMYSLAAEIEYSMGDYPLSEQNARVVLKHATSTNDKMKVFQTLVDALDAQGRGEQAVDISIELLAEYGEAFPRVPDATKVIVELVKIQKTLTDKSDAELIGLPEMVDGRQINILKLISIFGTIMTLTTVHGELLSLLSTLRVVKRSLQYGVAPISSLAYAKFGMSMAMIGGGHTHEAFRLGNIAVELLKRFSDCNIQAHTLAVVHGACRHWYAPLKVSLQPLMQAYEEGMVSGCDLKFSFLAVSNYLIGCFESGVMLQQVEVDMRTFCEGLDDMEMAISDNSASNTSGRHNYFKSMISPVWQEVLCLIGKSADELNPLRMVGIAMEEESFIQEWSSTNTSKDREQTSSPALISSGGSNHNVNNNSSMLVYSRAKLALAYHFDNLRLAEQLIEELEQEEKRICWHFSIYQTLLYMGLTHLHLGEQSPKSCKYHRSRARRSIQSLDVWVKDGNPNCVAHLLLLRAELVASSSSSSHSEDGVVQVHNERDEDPSVLASTLALFEKAIAASSKGGLPHLVALGYERMAMACFRLKDFREGARCIVRARDWYARWGAHAKVTYLQRKFHMFFHHHHHRPTPTANGRPAVESPQGKTLVVKEGLSINSIDVPHSPATSNTTKSR